MSYAYLSPHGGKGGGGESYAYRVTSGETEEKKNAARLRDVGDLGILCSNCGGEEAVTFREESKKKKRRRFLPGSFLHQHAQRKRRRSASSEGEREGNPIAFWRGGSLK